MKNLLFVSRVALIANSCLLLTILMRYYAFVTNKALQSTIIVAGLLLSFAGNLVVVVGMLVFVLKKKQSQIRPIWLFTFNFLCFIFQLYLLLK